MFYLPFNHDRWLGLHAVEENRDSLYSYMMWANDYVCSSTPNTEIMFSLTDLQIKLLGEVGPQALMTLYLKIN